MNKLRVYLIITSLAFLGFRFEKKTSPTKMHKSNGGRRIWTTYSQFACISLCSHELRAPILLFLYLIVSEGLKNKIKDFLSPCDYRWSTPNRRQVKEMRKRKKKRILLKVSVIFLISINLLKCFMYIWFQKVAEFYAFKQYLSRLQT